jgi:hypothetical protein
MAAAPTLAEVKTQLNINNTSSDAQLTAYLAAARSLVESRIGGPITTSTFSEVVNVRGNGLNLSFRPLVTVTSLVPLLSTWPSFTSTDVAFDPRSGTVWRKDLGTLAGAWTVSYTAGYADTIPQNWWLAIMLVVQEMWETRRGAAAPNGLAGDDSYTVPGAGYLMGSRVAALLGDSIYYGGIA